MCIYIYIYICIYVYISTSHVTDAYGRPRHLTRWRGGTSPRGGSLAMIRSTYKPKQIGKNVDTCLMFEWLFLKVFHMYFLFSAPPTKRKETNQTCHMLASASYLSGCFESVSCLALHLRNEKTRVKFRNMLASTLYLSSCFESGSSCFWHVAERGFSGDDALYLQNKQNCHKLVSTSYLSDCFESGTKQTKLSQVGIYLIFE